MTVSLTDEQAKNMAASLRNGTGVLASIANVLDPPTTPAPTPPSGGGSTVDPSGFTGRTLGDPALWRQQASFEENFPTLAPRGQFLNIYKMWSAYPTNYVSTDKLGIYDPYNIEVVELDGQKVMQVRVVSGKTNGRGKPSGACPQARWGTQGDGRTNGERIQMRAKVVQTGPGGHFVPFGWPPNNADWPQDGEPDYVEFDPNSSSNSVRGWFHVQNGGSSGQGQVELVSDVNANQWFVVTAERIPGRSYRWYVNGKLYKQVLAPASRRSPKRRASRRCCRPPTTFRWTTSGGRSSSSPRERHRPTMSSWPSITGRCGNEFEGCRLRGRVRGLPVEHRRGERRDSRGFSRGLPPQGLRDHHGQEAKSWCRTNDRRQV